MIYHIIISIIIFIFIQESFAKEVIIKKFSPSKNGVKSIYFAGRYSSDYNSKEFLLDFRHKYKNNRFTNQIDIKHQSVEKNALKKETRKTEEYYYAWMSNKFMIPDSDKYYIGLYNMFEQDKYDTYNNSEEREYGDNTYYYRLRNLAGIGKIFNKYIQADINIGWKHSKNGNSGMIWMPKLHLSHAINKKIRLKSRAFMFKRPLEHDIYIRNSISLKVTKKISFNINYNYTKSQNIYYKKINKVYRRFKKRKSSRNMTFGIKYFY